MSDFDPDLDFEESEGDGGSDSGGQNQSFKDLRSAYRKAEKERKTLASEVEELRQFRAEVVGKQTEEAITKAFGEVGLNPAHAKLYKALNPDVGPDEINTENVAKFAAEYALITTSGEPVVEPEKKPTGFTPFTSSESSVPGTGVLSMDDVRKLLDAGENEKVEKAFREGRVQKEQPSWTKV